MNYLKEILAFNEWAEINRLAISDFRLWHALMECNNRLGWCEWFQVPVIMLESKTGLEARTLSNAKNRLVKSGRLALRRGRGSAHAQKPPMANTPMFCSALRTWRSSGRRCLTGR